MTFGGRYCSSTDVLRGEIRLVVEKPAAILTLVHNVLVNLED